MRVELPESFEKRMKEICENTCKAYNAECEFKYTHEFVPLVNKVMTIPDSTDSGSIR